MRPAAREAMVEGMLRWANPSSPHAEGRAARAALEDARGAIGAAYGWSGDVLLTSGASESIAIGVERAVVDTRIVTNVEHDAVMRWVRPGVAVVAVDSNGLVDTVALDDLLPRDRRALVVVQWANSETGVRQPIAAIANVVHSAGGLLMVDAAQMPAGADPDVAGHADLVVLSAHKRGGPPGVGALLVRDLAMLMPTGGQERGYRPGTENLPGVLGYAAALGEAEPVSHYAELRASLEAAIVTAGGEIIGGGAPRHPAIGAYRMGGVSSAAQLIQFDSQGFAVSAGSACASGTLKTSHVLAAMGVSEVARKEVVRVSFGRDTSMEEVQAFAAAWRQVARAGRRFLA